MPPPRRVRTMSNESGTTPNGAITCTGITSAARPWTPLTRELATATERNDPSLDLIGGSCAAERRDVPTRSGERQDHGDAAQPARSAVAHRSHTPACVG